MARHQSSSSGWKKLFAAVLVGAVAWGIPAMAHETDQHTVPEGREFADVGPLLSRWHFHAIKAGVDKVNAEIKSAIDEHRDAELKALQDPDHLVRAVNKAFPWAMDVIEGWDNTLRSEALADQYPGRVVAYKHPFVNLYQHTHMFFDPRQLFRVWLGANLKAYDHYIGTDKIGHFTDEGMNYYNVYHKAREAGETEQEAIRKAIALGTDDWLLGEKGMLGLLTAGDYSNGDLVANWLGFSFYRNLYEPWPLQGKVQPAMCVRDGPYWKLAPHVRVDSDFFQIFVTDAEDEALNPGWFETGMRPALRAAVRDRRERVLEHYVDEHGCRRNREWFDRKLEEFTTYYGQNYGHLGHGGELVALGNTIFGPLSGEANVKSRDAGGLTPLHTAAWSGDAAAVQSLLSRGADPRARVRSNEQCNADWGNTPLHFAAASGNPEVVRLLLAAGADANARNDRGVTPLHRAVRFPDIAQQLIDRGARADAVDARGRTALHWAACDLENCRAVATLLVARGVKPDVRDHDGRTPLHLAADSGAESVARALIDLGADPSSADQFHETPLHLAAAHKFSSLTGVLLAAGAKANAADDFGCTALHDAARAGAAENLVLLLKAGASPTIANSFGFTPRQLAQERGCDTIVAELSGDAPAAVTSASVQLTPGK